MPHYTGMDEFAFGRTGKSIGILGVGPESHHSKIPYVTMKYLVCLFTSEKRKEQRAKSKEQKAKSKEKRAKSKRRRGLIHCNRPCTYPLRCQMATVAVERGDNSHLPVLWPDILSTALMQSQQILRAAMHARRRWPHT